ncbi:MAG: transposase [Verrucomicrobia bacterium]|nr:transposase [Verrucomicrobiota bacterium]
MPPVVFKGRPPRINPFGDNKWPVYFITCCALQRRPWLAKPEIHVAWQEFGLRGKAMGVSIGRYVIMPDHMHFFVRLAPERRLDMTVRGLKRVLSNAVAGEDRGEWQPGFFDHVLRREESLSEKWNYVVNNPVRAGLVNDAAEWPFTGEIVNLTF